MRTGSSDQWCWVSAVLQQRRASLKGQLTREPFLPLTVSKSLEFPILCTHHHFSFRTDVHVLRCGPKTRTST